MLLPQLDLINKYTITTVYNIPEINKIVITYSLKEKSEFSEITEVDFNNELRSVFISNLISGNNPEINYIVKKNVRTTNESIYNKLIIQGKKNIQEFLSFLILECEFIYKQTIKNSLHFAQNKTQNIVITIPLSKFKDILEFSELFLKQLNLNNIDLYLSLTLSHNNIKDIRNLYPFWNNHG